MITYTLDTRRRDVPQWWQRFVEYKIEDAIDCNIEVASKYGGSSREFTNYINRELERYDAYYDEGIFGKPPILEFASDEGHMLFMMEWI